LAPYAILLLTKYNNKVTNNKKGITMASNNKAQFKVTVSRVDDGVGEDNPHAHFNGTYASLLDAVAAAERARLAIEEEYADLIAKEIAYNMVNYAPEDGVDYSSIWFPNDQYNKFFINPDKPNGDTYYYRYAEGPLDYDIHVAKI
jgi:hypothetical protein